MRPRVFPAEDQVDAAGPMDVLLASMRPRVFPAEDAPAAPAAGGALRPRASMRPRVFPAEDPDHRITVSQMKSLQ